MPDSSRERRVHHRREASRVWAQLDGGWYQVHDLSLGGLAIERPVDAPGIGGRIEGEIHSRAGNRPLQTGFSATVVRVDAREQRIGASFEPMEPEQIDRLLAIMSSVERDYVTALEADHRRVRLRRALRRLVIGTLAAACIVAAGFAAWFVR